jgi:hypothetical protein
MDGSKSRFKDGLITALKQYSNKKLPGSFHSRAQCLGLRGNSTLKE